MSHSRAQRLRYLNELPTTADLVIIGGGIIGTATALYARRAGLHAVVLEKRPVLAGHTTMNATGAFRAQFDNPAEMALMRESITLFEHFDEIAGQDHVDLGLRQGGYLWVATAPATVARQQALVAQQQAWGLDDVEWLDGATARGRFPYLDEAVLGARWRARDGWLDVRKLALAYAGTSQAGICLETTVTGFDVRAGRLQGVITDRGVISTSAAVIAAGPFSGNVARLAGLELPFTLIRRQRILLLDVPEVPAEAPMTIDDETGAHWRPAPQGAHLIWTQPDVPPGPPLDDVPTSQEYVFAVMNPSSPNSVARIAPFWRTVWERGTSHWYLRAGQYTYTPDHMPFLGSTSIPGLFINAGYSGHGIMGSAGGSRIVLDTITGTLTPEQNPFRLDRPVVQRELDVI